MRIIFLGTPEFAVPSLDILVSNGYNVVAVVTATDKLLGRGDEKKLVFSPVKQYALEHNIPVLQPEKLKNPEFVETLRSYKADLQIVVAFRMLPEIVWNMPALGTMNLHGSLLPKYRGAAPINWAIINGDKETGVSTFLLKHEIDTGDLIMQASFPIKYNDNAGKVHDYMMHFGADILLKSVQSVEAGNYKPIPQNESLASAAPKIFFETCEINFNQNAEDVRNFIRGLSPYPAAWMKFNGKVLKVYDSTCEIYKHTYPNNSYHSDNKTYFKITVNDGFIYLNEVQLEGKKRLNIKEFLNGNKIITV